jgi:hypothetical protein
VSKLLWVALVSALIASAAGFFAMRYMAGSDDGLPPGPLASLQRHMASQGIQTHATLVRMPQINEVLKHGRYNVKGHGDKRFYVYWCSSPKAALAVRERYEQAPSQGLQAARGVLLIYMTGWPADDPLSQRVLAAFNNWPIEGAPS